MASLEGRSIADIDVNAVCDALENITPYEDLTTSSATKLHLMKVLTRRALATFTDSEA